MTTHKATSFIDKCIKDNDGRVMLWQTPNMPLWVWIVARLLVWPLGGTLETIARFVAFVALTIWAVLEVLSGVNYFRRALGLVVLVGSIASMVRGHF